VSRDIHDDLLRNAGQDQVANCGTAKVMDDQAAVSLLTVREFPCAENPAERGKLLGAAAIGAGGATAVAGGAEAAAAIKAMAEAHPYAAKLVKAAIKAGVGAEAYKHRGWLLDLLP